MQTYNTYQYPYRTFRIKFLHKCGYFFWLSFREHAKKLMLENDQLQSNMVQNEQESIEIFTLLQHNEEKKNNQVR